VDVHTWIGGLPDRVVPHPEAPVLARVLARESVAGAWVGHLPSIFAWDPHPSHDELFAELAPFPMLRAVPTVHPGLEGWEAALTAAVARGAVAIRLAQPWWERSSTFPELSRLAERCAVLRVPIMLGDPMHLRDYHELLASLVRAHPAVRIIATSAGRTGVSDARSLLVGDFDDRVWWDISEIAGPPADDLAALLRARGGAQFLYGSGWPLRLTQVPRANLELLPPDVANVSLADADAVGAPRANPE
jgi:hypothetical protein